MVSNAQPLNSPRAAKLYQSSRRHQAIAGVVRVTVGLHSDKRHRRQVYSQPSGRIGQMSTLPPQSEPLTDARARELKRGLWREVYLPVGIAGLVALLGTAALNYGAFVGLINHALLANTLVILLLTPALIITLLALVLIVALVFGLTRAFTGVASLLHDGQRISVNANRSARHYAHTTEMQFERIHRLVGAPARALRSLRQWLRGLR